jgi:hypothetical protein
LFGKDFWEENGRIIQASLHYPATSIDPYLSGDKEEFDAAHRR